MRTAAVYQLRGARSSISAPAFCPAELRPRETRPARPRAVRARRALDDGERWMVMDTTAPFGAPPDPDLPPHPLAEIFPPMSDEDYKRLRDSIRTNGYDPRSPIVLYEGTILDGVHRQRACRDLNIRPTSTTYTGHDPVGFVLAANLARRHLDASQRAMIAAKLATMRQGERTDLAQIQATSQPEAAALLNVSRSSVQAAKRVLDAGRPELVEAVERGTVKVSAAAKRVAGVHAEARHARAHAGHDPSAD
jgi:ParB-like chromosome segregation protein Spo0J